MKYEHLEIWNKFWCPHCHKTCWSCDGNPDDDTRYGAAVEAVKCPHCQQRFWIVDPEDSNYGNWLEEHENESGETVPGLSADDILAEYAFCDDGEIAPK